MGFPPDSPPADGGNNNQPPLPCASLPVPGRSILLIMLLAPTLMFAQAPVKPGPARPAISRVQSIALQDTTLRVALLLVQFADWRTNPRARGSTGWGDAYDRRRVIPDKYRYHHYWEMYFSAGSYRDAGDSLPPAIHPDAASHGMRAYGSFRDYYREASAGNLDILPALTHPDSALDSTSIFRSGIINNYRAGDSSIVWITLNHEMRYYYGNPRDTLRTSPFKLLPDALAKARSLYPDSLNVSIDDETRIDRVLIYVAGGTTGGMTNRLQGRFSIWRERGRVGPERTEYLQGFGGLAHEFGHQLGIPDYNGGNASDGLGVYTIMASGSHFRGNCSPNHFGAWEKLLLGWVDFEVLRKDTAGYRLSPVQAGAGGAAPKVLILPLRGDPGPGHWSGGHLEYFVLENRTPTGFDRDLSFGDSSFSGGLLIWHYAGGRPHPNRYPIRVLEADGGELAGAANLIDPKDGDLGSPADFFPGALAVTRINDGTVPSLRARSGEASGIELLNIRQTGEDSSIYFDIRFNTVPEDSGGVR